MMHVFNVNMMSEFSTGIYFEKKIKIAEQYPMLKVYVQWLAEQKFENLIRINVLYFKCEKHIGTVAFGIIHNIIHNNYIQQQQQ